MDEVTGGVKDFRMGEEKDFIVEIREHKGASLAALTATVEIYDATGTPVLAAAAMTVALPASNKVATASKLLTCKAGGTITAAGDYPAIVRWTLGTQKRAKQFLIRVKAAPTL